MEQGLERLQGLERPGLICGPNGQVLPGRVQVDASDFAFVSLEGRGGGVLSRGRVVAPDPNRLVSASRYDKGVLPFFFA